MKKIINLIILGLIITGFSSCLKDSPVIGPDAPGAIRNIVEFLNPGPISSSTQSTYPLYNKAFDIGPVGTTTLQVSYSGADVAPEDINVKVAVDPTAVDKYNQENQTSFVSLPSNLYSLASFDLVIPKGQRTANLTLNVKPDQFDFALSYALALKIVSSSVGTVSGNFGTVILSLAAKNKFDGTYTPQPGSFVQRYSSPSTPTNDALSGNASNNPDLTLTTIGPNSVQIDGLVWGDGVSLVGGIDNLQLTVDPTTNLTTIKSIANPSLANIPDAINKYDPDTKTFTLNFQWNPTANKRTYTLIIKYKGTR